MGRAYNVRRGWHDLEDDWMAHGACRDVADPTIFFADDGRNLKAKLKVTEARKICMECSLQERCLDYAMTAGIDDGVWGGTTGDERRARRANRIPVAAG